MDNTAYLYLMEEQEKELVISSPVIQEKERIPKCWLMLDSLKNRRIDMGLPSKYLFQDITCRVRHCSSFCNWIQWWFCCDTQRTHFKNRWTRLNFKTAPNKFLAFNKDKSILGYKMNEQIIMILICKNVVCTRCMRDSNVGYIGKSKQPKNLKNFSELKELSIDYWTTKIPEYLLICLLNGSTMIYSHH